MDQGKRLILTAVSNLMALGVSAVIVFLIAPYVLRHLGASTYRVWALIGSLLAYSGLVSLELNSAVSPWVSIYLVRNDVQGINRVVNTSLVAYLIGAGVFGAALGPVHAGGQQAANRIARNPVLSRAAAELSAARTLRAKTAILSP